MQGKVNSAAQKQPSCMQCPVRYKSMMKDLQEEKLQMLDFDKSCNVFRKGDVIFYEGNKPFGLFTIYSGKVKLYKTSELGKEQIIRLAKPGDPLGYRSLISAETYSATAEALEDTRLCFIPMGTFRDLLAEGDGVFERLMQIMSNDLKMAQERIASIATKSVRERTAESLLLLKKIYGYRPDGQTLNVQLSRDDLSNFIGTATESLIRMLAEFKTDKLIDLVEKQIVILNEPKLAKLANIED